MIFLLTIANTRAAKGVVDDFMVDRYGERVVRLPSGRPTIKGGQISISHTSTTVAIMVSDIRCGVDIERINRRVEHIAVRFATQAEIDIATQVLPSNAALLIWCAKEAAYKWADKQGVDFLRDMTLVGACEQDLQVRVLGRVLPLKWYVEDDLLIVHGQA